MARATRSSAAQEKQAEPTSSSAPARGKATSKKRKRTSIADADDQPANKQLRSGDTSIKEESGASQEPEDQQQQQRGGDKLLELQNAGDVPITDEDARKILDILEMIDTQGLLDRVFPLHSSSTEASNSQPAFYSFRTLLKESSQHPLCVLRSAIQHLFPISSHPRARPSTPAAQQLSFCNLALSLLDQASFHSVPIPLDLDSALPLIQDNDDDLTADTKPDFKSKLKSKFTSHQLSSEPTHDSIRRRKYALMQKLSGTEWWTSLNSEFGTPSTDGRTLHNLPTAHAELVSILPAPSATDTAVPIPTLGSYMSKKPLGMNPKTLGPRRTSSGRFLDYGPYASFAPSFEGEGVEVGRKTLGETIWRWEERSKATAVATFESASIHEIPETNDVDMDDIQEVHAAPKTDLLQITEDSLEGLLPPDEIQAIKAAVGTLELEDAVQELLDRNRRALERLAELQRIRLGAEGGGSSTAEEGSEEWDTAQSILNSLTVLASLRPRSSKDKTDTPPLVPLASALRKLHRTLPVTPSRGWYGTLPPNRPVALRDDSTIRVRSGAVIPVVVDPALATPQAAAAPPSYPVQPYRGPQQQLQQYKPGQQYYPPSQYAAQPTQAQGQGVQYYSNQQYGQSQYQYGSYYYQPTQAQAVAANTGSSSNGRSTPQPTGSFFSYNVQQQQTQPQRAVANTVMTAAGKQYQPTVNGTVPPPTLPPHMRNAWGGGGTLPPGAPVGAGYQQNSHYSSYQVASTAQ